MKPDIRVRAATAADLDFILALVPAFVDFGLPAGRDPAAHAARFADCLRRRWPEAAPFMSPRGPIDRRSTSFTSLLARTSPAVREPRWPTWRSRPRARAGASGRLSCDSRSDGPQTEGTTASHSPLL